MITQIVGDVFTTKYKIVGHGVNCQKAMNSGIARYIKETWPEIFEQYLTYDFAGGDVQSTTTDDKSLIILNIATQIQQGRNAELSLIEKGISNAYEWVMLNGYKGFAIPRIGSGIGGLAWDEVLKIIEKVSHGYPSIELEIYTQDSE